jgi:SH3 domain-containing YSC84-like protein 1
VRSFSAPISSTWRSFRAETDATLRAEVLSYSPSRGLFAGISLEGSTIRPDDGANQKIYGQKLPAKQIALFGQVAIPEAARGLISALDLQTPSHKSQAASNRLCPAIGSPLQPLLPLPTTN